jgi:hypothetical protein
MCALLHIFICYFLKYISSPNIVFSVLYSNKRWVWWCISVIRTVMNLKQEDYEFEASLCYIERPCLNGKKEEEKGGRERRKEERDG